MGFLRKGLFVATGGLSGVAVKANSKKERTANALEKQTKVMQQQAAAEERALHEQTAALRWQSDAARLAAVSERAQISQSSETIPATVPAIQVPASKPYIADELIKLKALRDEGLLTQAEFEAQKARWLAI